MVILRGLWNGLAVVGLVTLLGAVWFSRQGISAKPTPGPIETSLSRAARRSSARRRSDLMIFFTKR